MATLKQSSSFGANRFVARVFQSYMSLAARVNTLFSARQINVTQVDHIAAERAGQLLARALQEDSNLELDWLWYAANMTSSAHQRYCLRRALEINPDSEMAQRALAKLALHEHR
jgi:hypothetical protein